MLYHPYATTTTYYSLLYLFVLLSAFVLCRLVYCTSRLITVYSSYYCTSECYKVRI